MASGRGETIILHFQQPLQGTPPPPTLVDRLLLLLLLLPTPPPTPHSHRLPPPSTTSSKALSLIQCFTSLHSILLLLLMVNTTPSPRPPPALPLHLARHVWSSSTYDLLFNNTLYPPLHLPLFPHLRPPPLHEHFSIHQFTSSLTSSSRTPSPVLLQLLPPLQGHSRSATSSPLILPCHVLLQLRTPLKRGRSRSPLFLRSSLCFPPPLQLLPFPSSPLVQIPYCLALHHRYPPGHVLHSDSLVKGNSLLLHVPPLF